MTHPLAHLMELPTSVQGTLAGIYGIVILATIILIYLRRNFPGRNYKELTLRIRSWWLIILVGTLSMMISHLLLIGVFVAMSFLAFQEYLALLPEAHKPKTMLFILYCFIPVQYYCIAIGWYGLFLALIPVYGFLLLAISFVRLGRIHGFLVMVSTLYWGIVLTIFLLSHVAYVLMLPPKGTSVTGDGLLLYLLLLTELSNVAQYVGGKLWGKHKVLPLISPNKTREGLWSGIVASIITAVVLAPFITPFSFFESIVCGFLVAVAGFLGDATLSALKRDYGIKDTGTLLPGHGGVLDRLDSLIFTAPLFFHFLYYLHYA